VSVREAKALQGRLAITLDGQPTQNLDIKTVLVRIKNTGTEPISSDDFETDGYLMYGPDAEVLADGDIRGHPTRATVIALRDQSQPNQLLLKPLLINKGESIVIRALVKQFGGFILEGRWRGCPTPKEERESSTPFSIGIVVTFILWGIGSTLLFTLLHLIPDPGHYKVVTIMGVQTVIPTTQQEMILLAMVILTIIVFTISYILSYIHNRRLLNTSCRCEMG